MTNCCSTSNDALTVRDPVCGMKVNPVTALRHEHGDRIHYFCGEKCRAKFVADPRRYLQAPPEAVGTESAHSQRKDVIYTCSMHPEVRQSGPGTCPKCGMALEPVEPSSDEDDTELRDMQRRF